MLSLIANDKPLSGPVKDFVVTLIGPLKCALRCCKGFDELTRCIENASRTIYSFDSIYIEKKMRVNGSLPGLIIDHLYHKYHQRVLAFLFLDALHSVALPSIVCKKVTRTDIILIPRLQQKFNATGKFHWFAQKRP